VILLIGYNGKILWINLTSRSFIEEQPPEEVYKTWLGGYGLGVYYLYKNIHHGVDPLGPDNVLGFCPGLFTGSLAPITGKCFVCCKSPRTGGWDDSSIGGSLGMAIKKTGYDAIFIKGSSDSPVYLHVDGKNNEILDATQVWGRDTIETENWLKQVHGASVHSCEIGPGGENLLNYAAIINGFRAAGRGGKGAVMGAKKLKAICLDGSRKLEYADQKALVKIVKEYNQRINKNSANFSAKLVTGIAPKMGSLTRVFKIKMAQSHAIACRVSKNGGTAAALSVQVAVGDTPVKNFKGTYADFPMNIAQDFVYQHFDDKGWITGHQGCFGCPMQCGHVMKVPELNLDRCQRPEYESLAAFGPLLLNGDILKVIEVNNYLHHAGVDVISAGVVVAFVIECCEKGILKQADFTCDEYPDGFIPAWNDPSCILPLLRLIVQREGIGDVLAKGVTEASGIIGKNSEEFVMAINGQEIPMHDPRKFPGLTTTYIADPTPGRHTAASLQFQAMNPLNDFVTGVRFKLDKRHLVNGAEHARFATFMQTCNAIGLCEFALGFERYPMFELFRAITGWNLTTGDLFTIGHRIQVLRHMFNAREHAIRFDIPKRAVGIPPLTKGLLANVTLHPQKSIKDYFKALGLDETGVPTLEILQRLDLGFCIPDLASALGAAVPSFE